MAYTDAEKQARHRAKRKAQLQRYEAALQEIAFGKWEDGWQLPSKPAPIIARAALQEPSDA